MSEAGQTPQRGVPLTLEGKTYYLRFSLRTIRELSGDDPDAFFKKMSVSTLGPLLLAGLKKSAPDLTLDDLEEMIDTQNIDEVTEAVTKALGRKAKLGEVPPSPQAAADTVAKAD